MLLLDEVCVEPTEGIWFAGCNQGRGLLGVLAGVIKLKSLGSINLCLLRVSYQMLSTDALYGVLTPYGSDLLVMGLVGGLLVRTYNKEIPTVFPELLWYHGFDPFAEGFN